jgi:hypothetical protein
MCRHRPATWEAVVQGRLSRNVCLWFFPIVEKHFTLTENDNYKQFYNPHKQKVESRAMHRHHQT